MKTKFILLIALQFILSSGFSQYIGVRARYTETRTIDDAPNPPRREDHLILSFYTVSPIGIYTPVTLSNYDLWVYKTGAQYGSLIGGVLDSAGNNYPGYSYPAPKVVSYYNSFHPNWIQCDATAATPYVVNGQELDCGFVNVSYWTTDGANQPIEYFTAPNVCLPYYFPGENYALLPGNVNFGWPVPPTAPYNWYYYSCYRGSQQLIIRGVLPQDSAIAITLPVTFSNVQGMIDESGRVSIFWSNMTESNISHYEIERSNDAVSFQSIGNTLPTKNTSDRADYNFSYDQSERVQYYRIKAIENSGSVLYSSIIKLSRKQVQLFLSVYPNPVTTGSFSFQLANAAAGRYVSWLVNMEGQLFKLKMISHSGGDLIRKLDVTGLRSGPYSFVIRSADQRYSQMIIIKN